VQLLFFSCRRRHTRFSRDWSSDVCSSDLGKAVAHASANVLHANQQGHAEGDRGHRERRGEKAIAERLRCERKEHDSLYRDRWLRSEERSCREGVRKTIVGKALPQQETMKS